MRGWSWIGGALAVLVGATLLAGLVGAPRETVPQGTSVGGGVRAVVRVPREMASVGVSGEVRSSMPGRSNTVASVCERSARQSHGAITDGLANEIDRQCSAMRAAVLLLVAQQYVRTRGD